MIDATAFRALGVRATPWLVALVCSLAASGCVAAGADVHLAPFYTRAATGDGRSELELAGGLWRQRHDAASGRFESLTFGPLVSIDSKPNGDWLIRYLVPLGYTSHRAEDGRTTSLLIPVYLSLSGPKTDGSHEWRMISLPGWMIKSNSVSGKQFGWFPFWGRFENLLTYDEIWFVLWPLFVRAERAGAVSYHVPFPLFGWRRGGGQTADHVLPLYTRSRRDGSYRRISVLWPLLHYQENFRGPGQVPETAWAALPLYGYKSRGTYRAHTVLWPFFGASYDPRSSFWAVDAPWPLVRLQRGPGIVRRTRFWPFYGYLRESGLESTSLLFPFVWIRHEDTPAMERDSFYVIPLWQSWARTDKETGQESTWHKLFPLFQHERQGSWRRGSFPTLDPFQRNEIIDRHYGWAWKLLEWESDEEMRRERSWLGLWRREKDAGEDRRSLAGLWSSRHYREGGREVSETALFLGLLRWRVTAGGGFSMLSPAFPGPGWPAVRRPADLQGP
jgi:hypothetical protein